MYKRQAEIFAYLDEPQAYFDELSVEQAARVVSLMDSDDACLLYTSRCV